MNPISSLLSIAYIHITYMKLQYLTIRTNILKPFQFYHNSNGRKYSKGWHIHIWRQTIFSYLFNNFQIIAATVVLKRKSKWPDSWSKWPISALAFHNLKMPPCSGPLGSTLPLTGALKWGTVWTSTSTGTGIMKGQS